MSKKGHASTTVIMLDTNVILDYYLAERIGHESATKFITTAFNKGFVLVCAPTSLKDFYYLYRLEMKRRLKSNDETTNATASTLAWGCINNLLQITAIASMGDGDATIAAKLRYLHEDFEDDFLIATAMRCGATHIATSDKKLRAHSTIPALTCDELLLLGELGF